MANDYTTVGAVRALLGVDAPLDASYDALLTVLITQASRVIDLATGREPGAFAVEADSVRFFDGPGHAGLWIGELAAAPAEVAVAETGDLSSYTVWDAADYLPWPSNAAAEGRPYLRLDLAPYGSRSTWTTFRRGVRVTGPFGYASVGNTPAAIEQATAIQAVRAFKRAQQAYQDVGAIAELGQLRYVKALDPDVAVIVEHYRRIVV